MRIEEAQDIVRCPRCIEKGKVSSIQMQGSSRTLMSVNVFYDTEGRRHVHDPNAVRSGGQCSFGHHIIVTSSNHCPVDDCPFGKDQTVEAVGFERLREER